MASADRLLVDVQDRDFLEREIGASVSRHGRRLARGGSQDGQGFPFRFEDAIVARPSELDEESIGGYVSVNNNGDRFAVLPNSRDANGIGDLPLPRKVEERFHGQGTTRKSLFSHGPDRVDGRRHCVVGAKDAPRVRESDFHALAARPEGGRPENRLGVSDGSRCPDHSRGHLKSPRAAWPSISRTSTGAPTCSLIFIARVEPIVGMRARSLGFAFCRSFNVLKPRWNSARPRTRPTPRSEINSRSSSLMPYCTWIVSRVSARTFFLLKIRPSSPIEYRSHSA